MKPIDLQIHTTASDGNLSPKKVIDLAIKKGMKAIAITDHDTIGGLKEAFDYSRGKNLILVPGIEITCKEPEFNSNIDVIGLFINYKNKDLEKFIKKIENSKLKITKKIIQILNDRGITTDFEKFIKQTKNPLSRKELLRLLLKNYPFKIPALLPFLGELFGEERIARKDRYKVSIQEAITVIKNAKGISILAHPGRYLNESTKILDKFIEAKGEGLEVDYPYEKIIGFKVNQEIFRKIAQEKNLLFSGGSDFHDLERKSQIGDAGITEEEFEKLLDYKRKYLS